MSDYDIENDSDYYDDEEMIDGTQDEFTDEDDMDTEGLGGSFLVETKHKHKNYEIPYSSLSQSQVEKSMQEDVDHICGILGVDPDIANLLLRHMKWNKERLIEKYMDNGTSVMVAAGAAIEEPSTQAAPIRSNSSFSQPQMPARRSSRTASKLLGLVGAGGNKSFTPSVSKSPTSPNSTTRYTRSASPPKDGPFTCPICCDDTPSLRPINLNCSHQFCSNCWTDYLRSKIMDESEISIRCMAEGCGLVAPDSFIHTILVPSDPAVDAELTPEEKKGKSKLWARFQELVIRHFVGCNNSLKYCPYPSCTNTVSCPSAASKSSRTTIVPIVSCGARGIGGADGEKQDQAGTSSGLGLAGKEHQFCFGCTIESDHRPVVCAVARLWLKKCADDSETANWIKSNTKECPTCQSTIEKNGGCNHMTCKKCKGEFCWVCMGPWSEHGTAWYSCNRYDEKAGVEARDSQSRSRASLERYLHYYNRWANHEQSAKLSIDLYSKTEKKMEEMQITSSLTWIEVQFMKKAVEEAEKCRMTLKWTYAMAYYLAKGNQKDLFEDNQRDLEKAVEDLSELLESPIEPENIPSLRQKVTDKTVYVQKRNEIVLEDTATGFMEGRWKWNATVEGFDEPEKDAVAY